MEVYIIAVFRKCIWEYPYATVFFTEINIIIVGDSLQLKSSLVFPFGSPEMRQQFDDDHPLVLSNCTQDMFCLYYFSAPETGL